MMPAGYFDPVVPPQDGYSWGSVCGRPKPRGFASTKLVVGRQALTTRRVGLSVIQGWRYWMLENKVNQASFKAMRRRSSEHQSEEIGEKLRAMMPWIAEGRLVDKTKN